ncbi:MAG: CoA transferase [Chloroflexota bacterium]|nr:CoA transferase [Chloroflexota bacterium]
MPGPLENIKIMEFSEYIAGPFAGMLLSDMGAEILKIEPLWGDPWRHSASFIPNESQNFISLNRGKKSLPLDLNKPEAREIVYKLVGEYDVVIVNARPGVTQKLGIDYESLSSRKPDIVYCDNTAFGRSGPESDRPGYDLIAQAVTGLMASEAKINDHLPLRIQSTAITDFATGLAMALGICSALYHRAKTGQGQMVETNLLATALGIQTSNVTQIEAIHKEPRENFLRTLSSMRNNGSHFEDIIEEYRQQLSPWRERDPFYRAYQCLDGVIVVGCLNDNLRKKMLDLTGLEDPRFHKEFDSEKEDFEALNTELSKNASEVFKEKSTDYWLNLFEKEKLPAAPVRFPEELFADEQVLANNLIVEMEHTLAGCIKMPGPILKMSETPLQAIKPSPSLGEDTFNILQSLGYTPKQVDDLVNKKVTL